MFENTLVFFIICLKYLAFDVDEIGKMMMICYHTKYKTKLIFVGTIQFFTINGTFLLFFYQQFAQQNIVVVFVINLLFFTAFSSIFIYLFMLA